VQTVNATLTLCRRAPQFKAKLAFVELPAQLIDRPSTHVLHCVLQAHDQIRHEFVHRALVLYCPCDTLGNFYCRCCSEVAVIGAFCHCIKGSHATVALQTHATLGIKVFSW